MMTLLELHGRAAAYNRWSECWIAQSFAVFANLCILTLRDTSRDSPVILYLTIALSNLVCIVLYGVFLFLLLM